MCFYDANRNFIHIRLVSEMKGKSQEEKSQHYNKFLRAEIHSRLRKSYCPEAKAKFYSEAIDWVGAYDLEMIIINLFLEQDFFEIIEDLKPRVSFEGYDFKIEFIGQIYRNIILTDEKRTNHYDAICNDQIQKITEITNVKWDDNFVKKVCTDFDQVFLNLSESNFYLFYLLLISSPDNSSSPFVSAILLYNNLNKLLEGDILDKQQIETKLTGLVNTISELEQNVLFLDRNELFMPFSYNNPHELHQSKGLQNQMTRFKANLDPILELRKLSNLSFKGLVDEVCSRGELKDEFRSELLNRLHVTNYLEEEYIRHLLSSDLPYDFYKLPFIKRLYRFEDF
jgi:hypothetical protein